MEFVFWKCYFGHTFLYSSTRSSEHHQSFFFLSDFLEEILLSDFAIFPANMFLFAVRKNICTAPFLEAQEPYSWSTLKANVCVFLLISVRNFCSKDVVRFYLMGMSWGGGRLNSFLKAASRLGLVKVFWIFYFNWIFLKFNFSIIALKRWNFPENLDFKGKIVAKFPIRSHFLAM